MKLIKSIFCNFYIILPLIFAYSASCAVATFIENDHGTMVANAVVYRSWWFNLLHLYLALSLLASFIFSGYWKTKKYASLILHASFVFIIIGAGITRFYSFEGMMHIREGQSQGYFLASEPSINIMALDSQGNEEFYALRMNLLGSHFSKEKIKFFGRILELSDFNVKKKVMDKNNDILIIRFKAKYNDQVNEIELVGGKSGSIDSALEKYGDVHFTINYKPIEVSLPFALRLQKFELERYPGSMSPSSYASEVQVLDEKGNVIKPYRIFMNNVLDFEGYRFYQSSYDQDEKGTVLSVNRDPGKNITYLGYFMLILGSIWLVFSKNGRFKILARFLQNQKIASFVLIAFLALGVQNIHAEDQENNLTSEQKAQFLKHFQVQTKNHTSEFAKIQLQNFSGRIEPVDTIARNVIHKITHKKELFGMNENQLFLGIMLYPEYFKDLKMIRVDNPEIKTIIGVEKDSNYASLSDFLSPTLGYKLNNYVQESNLKDPAKRNVFDKSVLKVDERVNLAFNIFNGSFFKIFPTSGGHWLDPMNIAREANSEVVFETSKLLRNFFKAYDEGIVRDNWSHIDEAIGAIEDYQRKNGENLYLPEKKVKAEMLLNSSNIFSKLILPYLFLGILLIISVIYYIVKNSQFNNFLRRLFYFLASLCVIIHTGALLLRWYVSDHSPWSNAYESMLYIAWASGFAGIVFFRKYNLGIAASLFLSGICLFVANLGFMDPQITPLVPVLKSYWLNIHVSIITASYGFLGLCFILGIISLVLFIFRKDQRPQIDQSIYSLYAINEMSMILGLLFLTVGNFLGAIWANESWGRYWSWDPKETWALISIGIYAIVLHLRFLGLKFMPYVFSVASVIAFYSILMTYFGVNYYLSGMHSYAAGDPIPIPAFVYYFVTCSILLIVLAGFKYRLKSLSYV